MIADREAHFFRHVGFIKRGAPPAVIRLDQLHHCVVKQACKHDLLTHPIFQGQRGALQDVIAGGSKAKVEIIEQGRLLRKRRQSLHVTRGRNEKVAHSAAPVPRFYAGLDLRCGGALFSGV